MIINTMSDWGNVVRDRRIELGLSQEEVAEQIGKTRWWVMRFETGHAASASNENTLKLLQALGLYVEVGWEPELNDPEPAFITPHPPDFWENRS